ncbi:MAG: translation elongation factor 4 [Bacillales bacterium]
MNYEQDKIRNFSIIAHIDHGKSTLADRILELTNSINSREMTQRVLDSMEVEKERGITIKLNSVTVDYIANDNQKYRLNFIDTPGHVDFTYEVSRSLAACEGCLLIIDSTQGVQAQTLANMYLAMDNDLWIIPILNKIDLPSSRIEYCKSEITKRLGLDGESSLAVSAKTGEGIKDILEKIIREIPAPGGNINNPLKALIFDSFYDPYRGVIIFVRIKEGQVKVGDEIYLINSNKSYTVTELGIRTPDEISLDCLKCGEVGYICAQIKDIKDIHVGDTVTLKENPTKDKLPGYRDIKPMVYSGIYPTDSKKYEDLKIALDKLSLSDASLRYEPESSTALGFGFRCGFLGLLHMDVIQERLEREYNLDLILTSPSVIYQVVLTNDEVINLTNPSELPEQSKIKEIKEPFVLAEIMTPAEYVGPIMQLCTDRRGVYKDLNVIDDNRNVLYYELPLSEIIFNFFDKLKSFSRGYATLDYELIDYRASKLVKMDILLNNEIVDALSLIVFKDTAYNRGVKIVSKLKEVIPRQLFEVPIQAAISNKVIARANVKAVRKDVLAKCYGGDISRKRKLLEKQKEGKKRMKSIGCVEIPQDAFMSILSIEEN